MRERVERVTADLAAFDRQWTMPFAPARRERLRRYHESELEELHRAPFESLDPDARTDWVLLRRRHENDLLRLRRTAGQESELAPHLPFARAIDELEEGRRTGGRLSAEETAGVLQSIADAASRAAEALEPGGLDRALAWRVAGRTEELRKALGTVHGFFDGYDPLYTWWARTPYATADKSLSDYAAALKERIVGVKPDDQEAIAGVPIGREALLEELATEGIAHTPEELIAAARAQWKWCEDQMREAAGAFGLEDWRDAREHVKTLYVPPGEQSYLVRDLALEAIAYLKENDLVTVPPLAEETWRMEMMTPERQLVAPFFLGGECIMVSYPTDAMPQPRKAMALRGNNRHFARATVQHELIPGHHLQFFMTERHRPHRRLFSTAFWVEGWALHWEMLLWDLGFASTPEDRIGMLFWRMHRASRVIWSLRFHLGEMSPEECVETLVNDVGHERSTAEGEVRRSFGGQYGPQYGPLYQAAYLIGGLQMRALHAAREGSHREFHDAVLREGPIPLEVLRARLDGEAPPKDWSPSWRFL
jgi:hypothetical protein